MATISSTRLGTATLWPAAQKTASKSTSARRAADKTVVDLSQTAKLAQEIRSADASGPAFTQQLSRAMDQGKAITDGFAARLSGRSSRNEELANASRAAVVDILRDGKPASFWQRLCDRLFRN